MKLAFIIDNLGPYHVARLTAVADKCAVLAIEVHGASETYAWAPTVTVPFERVTLLSGGAGADPFQPVCDALEAAAPDVVFASGWSKPADLAALLWAGRRGVPAFVMSDSQAIDFPRRAHSEWIKRRILSHVSGAFVGGTPHAHYAAALGIRPDRIRAGYDVVDNAHFAKEPNGERRGFIASARFIGKKNLPLLLRAHAAYHAMHRSMAPDEIPWALTLLGDGPLRLELETLGSELGDNVMFRGFLQYGDLPAAYAQSGAFVHTSTTEQWGLVVNEAMAAGLPVLVSSRCGCVTDLIEDGVNGHALDPTDETAWAEGMLRIAQMQPAARVAMGAASQRIIARYTPETFADEALNLVRKALGHLPAPLRRTDALIIAAVAKARVWSGRLGGVARS